MSSQITKQMSTNNLYSPVQSAYRKNHGTETALLRVQNDILNNLDRKNCVFLVLLDLSAAIDTVDHATLLSQLESTAGITSSARQWISSYIHNRTQSVCVNGTLSSKTVLLYGVPQGSVLGPQLFIIYTGPIAGITKKHGLQVHLYADDTQLYYHLTQNLQVMNSWP